MKDCLSLEEEQKIVISNRIPVLLDVIERESIEFCVRELHDICGLLVGLLQHDLLYSLLSVRNDTDSTITKNAYNVMFWGCSFEGTEFDLRRFAESTKEYYEHIGDMDYYWGLS